MKKRDLLFYLAVFVALTSSAAAAAKGTTIKELRGDAAEQQGYIEKLETAYVAVFENWREAEDKLSDQQAELSFWESFYSMSRADALNELEGDSRAWTSAGEFRIYHYCPCELCTGKKPGDRGYGITATGTVATEGRTVAVDPDVIPIGSEVFINGVIYIAEDTTRRASRSSTILLAASSRRSARSSIPPWGTSFPASRRSS